MHQSLPHRNGNTRPPTPLQIGMRSFCMPSSSEVSRLLIANRGARTAHGSRVLRELWHRPASLYCTHRLRTRCLSACLPPPFTHYDWTDSMTFSVVRAAAQLESIGKASLDNRNRVYAPQGEFFIPVPAAAMES